MTLPDTCHVPDPSSSIVRAPRGLNTAISRVSVCRTIGPIKYTYNQNGICGCMARLQARQHGTHGVRRCLEAYHANSVSGRDIKHHGSIANAYSTGESQIYSNIPSGTTDLQTDSMQDQKRPQQAWSQHYDCNS